MRRQTDIKNEEKDIRMRKGQTEKVAGLFKIELNDYGDYIEVPIKDDAFFDCFAKGCKQIWGMSEGACKKLKKIERKYKNREDLESTLGKIEETVKVNLQFSKNAINIIDNIFGEGTVRKYFRKFYEEAPDFVPDVECFTDFLERITPVMKQLSEDRHYE